MLPKHYVYSPNNIWAEIRENGGREIYASGPGIPTLPHKFTIADMGNSIKVFLMSSDFKLQLQKSFDSPESFMDFCKAKGFISEAGVNHYRA